MKLAHRALLYSALIFPGGGHFLLKQHALGVVFAATATACLAALMVRAIEIAQSISERILSGDIPLDPLQIHAEIATQLHSAGSTMASVATWLLLGCWIVAGADAFRRGRQRDRSENADSAA